MATALTDLTATELAGAIARRSCSAHEAVAAHLERIEAINPQLNAVVAMDPAAALAAADRADQALADGNTTGPLHGVPVTVKDWLDTHDLVTAAGLETRREYRPKRDATVVARLRAAGAIVIAKTKPGSSADTHPEPHNPWNLTHTPGASSSGEAALIAARGSPLGLGSDSGGSLRWPAHCCGITTLKPTSGLVPLTGHVPPIIALTDPRTACGPMARSVADLALCLPLLAGRDGHDASVVPVAPGDMESVSLTGLRVAVFTGFAGASCDADTRAAVQTAADCLRDAGAQISDDCPLHIDEAMQITLAYWARPESNSWKTWQPWGKSRLSADAVEQSLFEWDRLRRAFTAFMTRYDLILCPAAPDPAPDRNDARADDYIYTLPFSLTGQPVAVIRCGTGVGGLPIGVQLVATPFADHVALAAAAAVEARLPAWSAPVLP